MGLAASCRGTLSECTADVEAAEKCFHVPATSLEALSTNRQHCRDMEAHFSGFHVGSVGVRVVVRGCCRHLACMGCVRVHSMGGGGVVGESVACVARGRVRKSRE